MVLDHTCDVEGFNGNQAEAVDQLAGSLMYEVMPPVADALMDA